MFARIQPLRCAAAGVLAGLASLIPGVSGGTMILAVGAYPRLVGAVADLSSLRFRAGPLASLAVAIGSALAAMFLAAGTARDLVTRFPVAALALFLGLTLGGIPIVARMSDKKGPAFVVGAALGLAASLVPVALEIGAAEAMDPSAPVFFGAGLIAAFAMVLPGISGSYLLLLMGMYVPFLEAADRVGDALRGSAALFPAALQVLPFLAGIVLGVVVGARLVRFCLERRQNATLGVLLGLLAGAAAGLWPFQTAAGARFAPEPGDVGIAVAAVTAGFLLTALIGRSAGPIRT